MTTTQPINRAAVEQHRTQGPICADCGGREANTPSGRWRHRFVIGHPFRPALPMSAAPARRRVRSTRCLHNDHNACGHGLLWNGEPTECECRCHDGAATTPQHEKAGA